MKTIDTIKTMVSEIVGYIPINHYDHPYRAITRSSSEERVEPLKVYNSENRAKAYSPVSKARAVYDVAYNTVQKED